jgi:hypothetical protein
VKQRQVVDVTQIPLRPQDFGAEMIKAVQVDIGEELARQIAIGSPRRRRCTGVKRSSPG